MQNRKNWRHGLTLQPVFQLNFLANFLPIFRRRFISLRAGLFVLCLVAEVAGGACPDTVALAPPPVNDRPLANWISQEIVTHFARLSPKRCWSILGLEKTAATFDKIGATTGFPLAPGSYKKNQIALVAEELNVTHILFPGIPSEDGSLQLKLFKIRDHQRLIPGRPYTMALNPDDLEAHRSSVLARYLTKLAPNSVTLGYSETDVFFNVDEKVFTRKSQTSHGQLPPLLSSVTLTRVDHRRGYRLFDVSGSILPATYFFGIKQDSQFVRKTDLADAEQYPEALSLQIETYGAAGSLNVQGSLYTPAGTSYVGAGWGPAVLWLQKQDRHAAWYLAAAGRLFFGHRVFMSDHLFVAFDWDSLVFTQSLYRTQYAKAYQVERSSFTLGWYFADSEDLAASMWHRVF